MGILEILGVLFITLKLCGVVDWSWLWVLSPFLPLFILLFVFITVIIMAGIQVLFEKLKNR